MAHPFPSHPYYGGFGPPYYPQQNQYPQQQQAQPSVTYQPQNRVQHAPIPHNPYNIPRFDANQMIPPPGSFPPFSPASFTPESFRQFSASNSSFPPPVPPLYAPPIGTFAQFQQSQPPPSLPLFPPGPLAPPNNIVRQQEPSKYDIRGNAQEDVTAEEQQLNSAKEENSSLGSSEEGEVSDGEVNGNGESTASKPVDVGHNLDGSAASNEVLSHPSTKSTTAIQKSFEHAGASESQAHQTTLNGRQDRDASTSSYTPPSVSSPESKNKVATTNNLPKFEANHSSSARDSAKDALKSLASFNITYAQMIAEGLNPQVLKELYTEVGSGIDHLHSASQTENLSIKHAQNAAEVHSFLEISARKVSGTSFHSKDTQQLGAGNTLETSFTSINSLPNVPNSPAVATLRVSPQSSLSPSMERKDRIAQLLAAKTGKLSSTRISPKPGSPASNDDKVHPTGITISHPLSSSVGIEGSVTAPHSSRADRTAAERQRIPQAHNVGAVQGTTDSMSTIVRTEKTVSPKDTTLSGITSGLAKGRETMSGKSSSNTILHDKSKLQDRSNYAIPGLFMTAAELDLPQHLRPIGKMREASPSTASSDRSFQTRIKTKRSHPDDISEDDGPNAKRALIEPGGPAKSPFVPIREDSADMSEGEIMEIDSAPMSARSAKKTVLEAASISPRRVVSQFSEEQSYSESAARRTEDPNAQPPSLGMLQGPGRDHLWQTNLEEIEAMRKRIADIEEKRRLQRSQSQVDSAKSSAPSTPGISAATPLQLPKPAPKDAPQIINQLPQALDNKKGGGHIQSSTSATTPAPDALAARAAQLKAEFLRQRALRQRSQRDRATDVEADIERARSTLAEKQAELVRMKEEEESRAAESRLARKRQEELQAELLRLEERLKQGSKEPKADVPESTSHSAGPQPENVEPMSELGQSVEPLLPSPVQERAQISPHVKVCHNLEGQISPQQLYDSASGSDEARTSSEASNGQRDLENNSRHISPDEVGDGADPTLRGGSLFAGSDSGSTSAEIDELYQNALHKPSTAMELDAEINDYSSARSGSMEVDSGNDSQSDGSASMSDSPSEEYEPVGADEDDETEDYDPENSLPSPGLPEHDRETVYEPPEPVDAGGDATEQDVPIALVPGFDILAEVPSQLASQEIEVQCASPDVPPEAIHSQQDERLAAGETEIDSQIRPSRFIAYQSPLSSLKSYRFNSGYHNSVKDGYRSLTFSYDIDPKEPLCPTELAGETCSDPTCDSQHFRQMALADAKILEQLASATDFVDASERDQFLVGLKEIIAGLRARGVKDFSEVADELAAYRRRFREQRDPALIPSSSI